MSLSRRSSGLSPSSNGAKVQSSRHPTMASAPLALVNNDTLPTTPIRLTRAHPPARSHPFESTTGMHDAGRRHVILNIEEMLKFVFKREVY